MRNLTDFNLWDCRRGHREEEDKGFLTALCTADSPQVVIEVNVYNVLLAAGQGRIL